MRIEKVDRLNQTTFGHGSGYPEDRKVPKEQIEYIIRNFGASWFEKKLYYISDIVKSFLKKFKKV